MDNLRLCDSDYRFMLIVWDNAPIGSGKLVEICRDKLGWKKSTDYFVDRTFGGSLPDLMAAFFKGRKISQKEAQEIKKLIDEHSEEWFYVCYNGFILHSALPFL